MTRQNRYDSDYLVIGAGLAGLAYALEVAEHGTVIVLSKREPSISNTAQAQGGIAAVWDSAEDSVEQHVQDTLEAGAWLASEALVRGILSEGKAAVEQLIAWGVKFTRQQADPDAPYHLTREGGHSARRILHHADMTGSEVQRAMLEAARAHPSIRILSHRVAIDLITQRRVARFHAKTKMGLRGSEWARHFGSGGPEGWMPGQRDRCLGAYVLDQESGEVDVFTARATLLASGGAGKVYLYTSNPDLASGDGVGMAWRAGAAIANMEFVQFHPTCLYHPRAKSFLISEAVRGEGGILRLPDGTPFMDAVHPRGSLAPRDIVAREIDKQLKKHGLDCVYLDVTGEDPERIRHHFRGIDARLQEFGIDMTKEPIPVVPAAHYFCGGIKVDEDGGTYIDGLYAAGEVTCTGLHGANRLASNSLLEAAVYARRAAQASHGYVDTVCRDCTVPAVADWEVGEARDPDELVVVNHMWDEIRRLMWNYVGIVRTDRRLYRAMRRIVTIQEEIQSYYWNFTISSDLIELRNLAQVAELVIRSALSRRESRGLHYNADVPEPGADYWRRDTILRRDW